MERIENNKFPAAKKAKNVFCISALFHLSKSYNSDQSKYPE